jgi:hypothetical protein
VAVLHAAVEVAPQRSRLALAVEHRSTTRAPSNALCIARYTPDEKTGSTNAYASPIMRKRSPLLFALAYE